MVTLKAVDTNSNSDSSNNDHSKNDNTEENPSPEGPWARYDIARNLSIFQLWGLIKKAILLVIKLGGIEM
jgi:hypothetical protein